MSKKQTQAQWVITVLQHMIIRVKSTSNKAAAVLAGEAAPLLPPNE